MHKFSNPTAPTHGPTNLTVVDTGPSHIHLTWSHPPEDAHQGIIRKYHVYTTEQETGKALFNATTADDTEILLSFLHPFYVYHIKVAAFTVQEGNFTSLSVRTKEAGMQYYMCVECMYVEFLLFECSQHLLGHPKMCKY